MQLPGNSASGCRATVILWDQNTELTRATGLLHSCLWSNFSLSLQILLLGVGTEKMVPSCLAAVVAQQPTLPREGFTAFS